MIKIKVCGMRDPANIIAVMELKPDYMGFIFYKGSQRFVGDNPELSVFHQIPAEIEKTGVFVNEQADVVIEKAYKYDLKLVQLHGNETVQDCIAIRSTGYKVIKAFGINLLFNFNDLKAYLKACDYFLFDTRSDQYGGTGLKFDWHKMREYPFDLPFFLSGGIASTDAAAISELHHPALHAVDINSKFEVVPGMKDANQVKEFIHQIRHAESADSTGKSI
jgi:phosphoribosylanthranilate isomerase